MKLLISEEELKKYKAKEGVPCECKNCKQTFYITKSLARRGLKGTKTVDFCCRQCARSNYSESHSWTVECKTCHKEFKKLDSEIKKSENHFCSQSCAATFNNTVKPKRKRDEKFENKTCLKCDANIPYKSKRSKFCSHKCQHEYQLNQRLIKWKNGDDVGYSGKTINLRAFIRRYLFNKYNHNCCKCGWNKKNPVTNKIPLEVNHIDGNAKNCKEDNLELLCPNCHSLTPNFRSLNKNSPRNRKGAAKGI